MCARVCVCPCMYVCMLYVPLCVAHACSVCRCVYAQFVCPYMSQVTVHSIHIRYEDTITNPGQPMAVGITLDSIEMKVVNITNSNTSLTCLYIP